jgi:hypothetical protein
VSFHAPSLAIVHRDEPAIRLPLHSRNLGDKILLAFRDACDNQHLEVASLLLIEYERTINRAPRQSSADRRREMDNLVAAHSILWCLLQSNIAVQAVEGDPARP